MKSCIAVFSLLSFLFAGNALGTTTLSWWQFWTDPNIKPTIDSLITEFEQANPDISVEPTDLTWANGHEKIVIAFSSGSGPDVVELGSDWIAQFAASSQIAVLSDQIADDSSAFQGWSMANYKGGIYGFPWILGTRVLFGNRDLLIRAGFDSTFIPYNWDTFKRAVFKVDSLGRDIYGWGSNTAEKHRLYKKYLPFFWSAGARFFTEDNKYCVVSSRKAVDALKLYKLLHDSCGYVGTQRRIEDAFLDGKIGFIISGDWLLKRIKLEHRKINLIATSIPGPKYPGKSFLGGEFLAINARSDHSEEALRFIRFLTSPENQVRFCKANMSANPSSLKAREDPYFTSNIYLEAFIRQIRASVHPPVDPDWVYMEDIIEKAVEDALFGSGLPASALRDAQIRISKLKQK